MSESSSIPVSLRDQWNEVIARTIGLPGCVSEITRSVPNARCEIFGDKRRVRTLESWSLDH